ncbi:MAG: mersacidin/lichenicidin family type 2 lantibiotic [Planctomycetales bacterium]|nr:mersacidin/lichenicidin family type 2 lantibiotic [Planctomycetales bacterium]
MSRWAQAPGSFESKTRSSFPKNPAGLVELPDKEIHGYRATTIRTDGLSMMPALMP